MMNALDYLMMFNQDRKCFVADMVEAIEICQLDLYDWYINPQCAYNQEVFRPFKDLYKTTSCN